MDSHSTIALLYEVVGKKEFHERLVDLVFKEAKNKDDVGENLYIQIPKGVTELLWCAFYNCNSLT